MLFMKNITNVAKVFKAQVARYVLSVCITKNEHSKNTIIGQSGLFQNQFRNDNWPEVLQSSIQQAYVVLGSRKHRAQAVEGVVVLSWLSGIYQSLMLRRYSKKATGV